MKPPIPPNWIDVLFVLASPINPPATILLAVFVILIRHAPWLSTWLAPALWSLAGRTEVTPWGLVLLPALAGYVEEEEGPEIEPGHRHLLRTLGYDESDVMSGAGSGSDSPGSGAGSGQTVLPQQNQLEPGEPFDFGDLLDYLKRHNLTDQQAIDLLAVLHRDAGDLLSANKIRDIVGGNDAAVKARVAAWRPASKQQRTQGRTARPHGGW